MAKRSRASRLNQALWIAAGVVVLTVVIVILSWLTAGGEPAPNPEQAPIAPVPTAQVERPTFQPEAPQGGRPEAPPAAPPSSVAVEDLPKTEGQTPPEVSPAQEPTTGGVTQAPVVTPAPPPTPSKPSPPPVAASGFGVQVGAFGSEASVREMSAKLERLGYKVVTRPKGNLTRVIAAGYADRAAAEKALQKLRAQGLTTAQVVPLE